MTSLDGLRFRAVENERGEVDAATEFLYGERDGMVWGGYAGGAIRVGALHGTRTGDELEFTYAHVNGDGERAAGRCRTRIETLPDGRLRLHESWQWTSREGSGTSIVEQIPG